MNDFYVYVYFDMCGIPRYIGKGRDGRWLAHLRKRTKHKNKRLKYLLAEHGAKLPRLKLRENLTEAEAFETEIAFIEAIGKISTGDGPLFNLTDGGEGAAGGTRSPELRAQIAAKLRGVKHTEERRRNSSLARKGVKQAPEWVASRVAGRAGYKHSAETKAAISAGNKGKTCPPVSEETRRKISASSTGRKHSTESIELMRKTKLGKKRPPFSAEHRAKTSATMKLLRAAQRAAKLVGETPCPPKSPSTQSPSGSASAFSPPPAGR